MLGLSDDIQTKQGPLFRDVVIAAAEQTEHRPDNHIAIALGVTVASALTARLGTPPAEEHGRMPAQPASPDPAYDKAVAKILEQYGELVTEAKPRSVPAYQPRDTAHMQRQPASPPPRPNPGMSRPASPSAYTPTFTPRQSARPSAPGFTPTSPVESRSAPDLSRFQASPQNHSGSPFPRPPKTQDIHVRVHESEVYHSKQERFFEEIMGSVQAVALRTRAPAGTLVTVKGFGTFSLEEGNLATKCHPRNPEAPSRRARVLEKSLLRWLSNSNNVATRLDLLLPNLHSAGEVNSLFPDGNPIPDLITPDDNSVLLVRPLISLPIQGEDKPREYSVVDFVHDSAKTHDIHFFDKAGSRAEGGLVHFCLALRADNARALVDSILKYPDWFNDFVETQAIGLNRPSTQPDGSRNYTGVKIRKSNTVLVVGPGFEEAYPAEKGREDYNYMPEWYFDSPENIAKFRRVWTEHVRVLHLSDARSNRR